MYDNYLRHVKDAIATPICSNLPASLSPNITTLLAFVAGLLSISFAAFIPTTLLGLIFWLLNRVLDGLDGSLARTRKDTTSLGGFLDLLGDFIVYSLIPIGLGYGSLGADWRAIAILEGAFHINNFVLFYVAAVVAAKPHDELTSVAMQPALIEGFESGLLFTAMYIWPQHLTALCWVMSAAVVIGTAQRVLQVVPVLRRLDEKDAIKKTA